MEVTFNVLFFLLFLLALGNYIDRKILKKAYDRLEYVALCGVKFTTNNLGNIVVVNKSGNFMSVDDAYEFLSKPKQGNRHTERELAHATDLIEEYEPGDWKED